jgi:hypothetical protein
MDNPRLQQSTGNITEINETVTTVRDKTICLDRQTTTIRRNENGDREFTSTRYLPLMSDGRLTPDIIKKEPFVCWCGKPLAESNPARCAICNGPMCATHGSTTCEPCRPKGWGRYFSWLIPSS